MKYARQYPQERTCTWLVPTTADPIVTSSVCVSVKARANLVPGSCPYTAGFPVGVLAYGRSVGIQASLLVLTPFSNSSTGTGAATPDASALLPAQRPR